MIILGRELRVDNQQLKELFYSKEMESLRQAYYNEAYRQGEFDKTIRVSDEEESVDYKWIVVTFWERKLESGYRIDEFDTKTEAMEYANVFRKGDLYCVAKIVSQHE